MKKFKKVKAPTEWLHGDYVIIDPCYVFSDDDGYDWHGLVDIMFDDDDDSPVVVWAKLEGHDLPFVVFGTAYGDGIHKVVDSWTTVGKCSVDAGCLAIIPASLLETETQKKTVTDLGVIVKLDGPFYLERQGVVHIGSLTIDTARDYEENEEEDEDEDDWYDDEEDYEEDEEI